MKINHNQNKFNKGLKGLLFKEIRFDVSKHPVISSTDKASSNVRVNLSKQEKQMFQSLAKNHFQGISAAKAARICIYEECMDCSELNGPLVDKTHRRSIPKGHSQRAAVQIRLTDWEMELLQAASNETDLSTDHLIRYAIVRLNKRIKEGTCTKLTNSKLLSQQECQKQDAKKPKNPSKIVALVKANKEAQAEIEQKKEDYYEAFGEFMQALNAERWGRGYQVLGDTYEETWIDLAREQFHEDLNERIEALYQENKGEQDLLEIMTDGFEIIWFRTKKQAQAAAKMFIELKEAETLIDPSEATEELLTAQDLYTPETTYKPAQRHRGHAERRPTYTLNYNRMLNYMIQTSYAIESDRLQDLEWAVQMTDEVVKNHLARPDSYVEDDGNLTLDRSSQEILKLNLKAWDQEHQ